MMKKYLFTTLFLIVLTTFLYPAQNVYRYGIFVSSSKGFNENDLPGAENLVKEVETMFRDYCLLDETALLHDPDNSSLDSAFKKAKEFLADKKTGSTIQFFFYYYGHGMPDGLLLNNQIYSKRNLKRRIAEINANVKLVFLDACSSQILSNREKIDFSTDSEGTIFITSSTQFQKAFTEVFTPILKAGLMGDADGFIPRQIDAPFFYNEITAKLTESEREYVCSLYNFNEFYKFQETSEEDKKRMEQLFTALGVESIPESIHITTLEKKILNQIDNKEDEQIIRESYNYNPVCTLKETISKTEEEGLLKSLEKIGFKQDNYVTLSELFSYIQTRIAEKNINGQRPTITTSYFSFSDTVPLSFFDNKIALHLRYPGIIFVKKVGEDSLLENIVKIVPTLDEGKPVRLYLDPGHYTIVVQTKDAKHAIDITLYRRGYAAVPVNLSWENLVSYRIGDTWHEKAALDKKIKLNKRIRWIPPTATFVSLSLPISLMVSEICYTYYLQNQYNNSSDPNRLEQINRLMDDHEKIRNSFYIAAGVCFAIPIVPLVFWIVRGVKMRKLNNEIEDLKEQYVLNYLPEIIAGPESVGIAYSIKLK